MKIMVVNNFIKWFSALIYRKKWGILTERCSGKSRSNALSVINYRRMYPESHPVLLTIRDINVI